MLRWVDLFSARVAGIADPEDKRLVADLVADNARHMVLLRERARAGTTLRCIGVSTDQRVTGERVGVCESRQLRLDVKDGTT